MSKERIYCGVEESHPDEACGHGMFRIYLARNIHGDSLLVECPKCNEIVMDISLDECECEDLGHDYNDMLWEIRADQMSR